MKTIPIKLNEPKFKTRPLKGKAVFFFDWMGSAGIEPKEEMKNLIEDIKVRGYVFTETEFTERPPFGRYFDFLFFDWGGAAVGNSLLEHLASYLIEDAGDNPNKLYCIVSRMSVEAVRDAQKEMGVPGNNVFYCLDDFITYIDKYYDIFLNPQINS